MGGDRLPRRLVAPLLLLAFAASACAPASPQGPRAGARSEAQAGSMRGATPWVPPLPPRVDAAAAVAAYAGARTYSGMRQCPGCAAERLTLTIFADGTFRARSAGEIVRYDIGRWARSTEAHDTLVLSGAEGVRRFRRVVPDGLAFVDDPQVAPGRVDAGALSRAPQVDPLPGPIRLAGHYRREAGEPVLVECSTGRSMPVVPATPASGAPQDVRAFVAAQSALDAAHRAVSLSQEAPVLAIVRGYVVPHVVPAGRSGGEAVVVAAFERAMRDGRCEDVARDVARAPR